MSDTPLPLAVVDDVVAQRPTGRVEIINRDPVPDEVGVERWTNVFMQLAALGGGRIDEVDTRVWVDGVLAYDGTRDGDNFRPPFDGRRSRVDFVGGDMLIWIDPVSPFASQQVVSLRVQTGVVDIASAEFTYAFTVEDLTAPQLVGAVADGPRSVRLSFDEPVRVTDLAGFTFERLTFPAVPLSAVSAMDGREQVTLTLDTQMSPGRRYAVEVLGVEDLNGNAILVPFNRATFEGYRPKPNASRRFDLWSMLPKYNRRQDITGDLKKFIACLQEVVDLLLADIDCLMEVFDPERAPAEFLDLILADLGNPFPFVLDDDAKRRLAGSLVRMYKQKGTEKGIRNAVRFFLGIEIDSIATFAGTPLTLGESELGVDWELGPSDRFSLYAFDIHVGVVLTDEQRVQLRKLVEYLKPAHTHFIDLVEPRPPEPSTLWDLGESELGIDTELN